MKKFFLATLLTLFFCSPAESIDLTKIKCQDFLTMGPDEMGMILIWFDGYISAQSGETQIDKAWLDKLAQHLGEFCHKNPEQSIMEAIKPTK